MPAGVWVELVALLRAADLEVHSAARDIRDGRTPAGPTVSRTGGGGTS